MLNSFRRLSRVVRPPELVPVEYRRTFLHMYMDVVWFGILNGTAIAFLAVFATRQGATTNQIGLLTAAPAIINLIFTLPVGNWLSRQSIVRSVFWSSVAQRVFYLLLVPLPLLLMPKEQVWAIILMTLIMSIPGTVVVVGFNALFGEVVPLEWRGYVVGIRNASLSVTSTIFTLLSGFILSRVPFPLGYQIVFFMGFMGAALSSLHLYILSRIVKSQKSASLPVVQGQANNGYRIASEIRAQIRALILNSKQSLRLDPMKGRFGVVMGLVFGWHFFQFSTIPIITPFVVNGLHLSDQTIGVAGAIFSGLTFVGSLILNRFTIRFGNRVLSGVGVMGLAFFPILLSTGATGYIIANIIGGLAWALAGGALYNYVLENAPATDLPAHLAWYNLIFNAGVLMGSFVGPTVAGIVGYQPALVIFGAGRFLAGLAIFLWG